MTWFAIIKEPLTTYVVNDNVWQEAGGEGMDSIEDLEEKLGRKLNSNDFTDDPINWWPKERYLSATKNNIKQYDILRDRLPDVKEKINQYSKRPQWKENQVKGKTDYNMKIIEEALV